MIVTFSNSVKWLVILIVRILKITLNHATFKNVVLPILKVFRFLWLLISSHVLFDLYRENLEDLPDFCDSYACFFCTSFFFQKSCWFLFMFSAGCWCFLLRSKSRFFLSTNHHPVLWEQLLILFSQTWARSSLSTLLVELMELVRFVIILFHQEQTNEDIYNFPVGILSVTLEVRIFWIYF